MTTLILASASPRRRELLHSLGLSFAVKTTAIDETPRPGESPPALVQRLSRAKALAAAQPGAVVIAADTVVVWQEVILGKPANATEAAHMLRLLRHRSHDVYSGLTLHRAGMTLTRLHQSRVWMRPYTEAEIAAYIATGSPLDKAGAYGIQDTSFAPVERLEGCFASVMGLPLGELAAAMSALALSPPPVAPRCRQYTGHPCCMAP